MDIKKFKEDLQEELSKVPPEAHIAYLEKRIATETDDDAKSILEIYIDARRKIPYNSPPNENILVLVHGIRTEAIWHDLLSHLLKDDDIEVKSVKYEWFDAVRFWLPYIFRRRPINTVLDEFRDIRNMHRTANISVIAHSFGTYILSKILSANGDVQLHRVILCGSIVKENFKWSVIPSYPTGKIINDCGTEDIWPLLAKKLSWGYGVSGRAGFNSSRITNRYHNVKHDGFFSEDFVKCFWIPFITDGIVKTSDWSHKRSNMNYAVRLFSLLPVKTIIFIGLAATIFSTNPF